MRGIAELMEVTKSAPPTPSPIPRAPHVNGHAPPPSFRDQMPAFFEESKTPEPQDDEKTIIAPPSGFDEPDLKRNSHLGTSPRDSVHLPPGSTKTNRQSQEESALLNMTSEPARPRAWSNEHQREGSNVSSDGGGSFNKMRHLLEQRMGVSQSNESLEMSTESETNEQGVKSSSRSPSHSPRIARKKVRHSCTCIQCVKVRHTCN